MLVVVSLGLLAGAALLGSGILFRRQRFLTWLSSAAALLEAQWLLLTAISRIMLPEYNEKNIFFIGALLSAGLAVAGIRRFQLPQLVGWLRREVVVLGVILITTLGSWLVLDANGFKGGSFVLHGFYNGDTATLAALTERSLTASSLVRANPFAGGGALEYPTLLHGGIAAGLSLFSIKSWLALLPILTIVQIVITVPLLFLLMDLILPEPTTTAAKWLGISSRRVVTFLEVVVVLYVMALSWDSYIYPQSHFFLYALFLLFVCLMLQAATTVSRRFWQSLLSCVVGLILVLSNAVLGTVAAALLVIFFLLRAEQKNLRKEIRVASLVSGGGVIAAFLLLTAGSPSFGFSAQFPYTAVPDMIRLAPPLIMLLVAVWLQRGEHSWLMVSTVAVPFLALITFIFSQREIIAENASRFFYHSILIAYPLLVPLIIRSWYIVRRELRFTSRPLSGRFVASGIVVIAISLLALPALGSVASAYDNLLFKDEQIIHPDGLSALDWIKNNTAPDSIFVASPSPPWAIPYFTGRSLLRADYWLSPHDTLLGDTVAAFAGDSEAQQRVLTQADYLFLREHEQSAWGSLSYPLWYRANTISIYKLR